MIGPAHDGKTLSLFLRNDCALAAVATGLVPIYVDLSSNPLGSICQALIIANPDLLSGSDELSADLALRLDQLAFRWARISEAKVVLMLDNAQSLHAHGYSLASTLRALLTRHARHVTALFVGSSRLALAEATTMPHAPLYQFIRVIDFPTLGPGHLKALL